CGPYEADDGYGNCVRAKVLQNVYLFNGQVNSNTEAPPPAAPTPRIDYNVVFVNLPLRPDEREPIVVPPPQQRTLIYVLSKTGSQEQRVIEVPAGQSTPEVFYVNYNEGDNPTLPGGQNLQEILQLEGQRAQTVLGGSGAEFPGGHGQRGHSRPAPIPYERERQYN
ncbi:UNVERIFIED_CONTAM: hypothetical protein GTU68_007339, partial [Idotea baltica]|nr:hypothetical protein [Idotea baltica]